jgi:hypothetical protein
VTLAPLANLVAVRDPDPQQLETVERWLQSQESVHRVWRPAAGWLVAELPLPGAKQTLGDPGLVFAEGSDHFEGPPDYRDLSRHPGDFSFLHFTEDAVTAVRSCSGRVPVYVWSDRERAVVGTTLSGVCELLPQPPVLDPLALACWASLDPYEPWNRTVLAGVRAVPPGHSVHLTPGAPWRPTRYWDMRPGDPAEVVVDPEGHAAEFREGLLATLDRELDREPYNLLTLSGGVDSTSLAALAAGVLDRPVATLSLVPLDPVANAREQHYREALAGAVVLGPSRHYALDLETQARLFGRSPGLCLPTLHPALRALPEVVAEIPASVLFGGEWADDTCGHWWRVHDWIDRTSARELSRSLRRLPFGRSDLLRWPKWRLLSAVGRPRLNILASLLELARHEVEAEYQDWRSEQLRMLVADERPNRFLAAQFRGNASGVMAMNWEASSACGVRRAFPFLSRELLELAGRCDPRELLGPGTKRVMRAALRGLVPDVNLDRPDKGAFGRQPHPPPRPWLGSVPAELESTFAVPRDAAIGPVSRAGLALSVEVAEAVRQRACLSRR